MKTKQEIEAKLKELETQALEASEAKKQVLRTFYRYWKERLEAGKYAGI
jgi:hypothetical protein